jgi:hypothetical protein
MIAELRIYTANRGKLDDFVKLWNEKLAPNHERYGLKILGAWINRPQNEFIWIRVFDNEADRDAKTKTYFDSPERKAIGDLPASHLAKLEVRTIDNVYGAVNAVPRDAGVAEIRIYTMNRGMLDDFVKLWSEQLVPIHEKYGMRILGAWVNRPQNEFIWVRIFDSEEDRQAKTAAYPNTPERKAIGDAPQRLEAKIEVRVVENVFAPAPAAV